MAPLFVKDEATSGNDEAAASVPQDTISPHCSHTSVAHDKHHKLPAPSKFTPRKSHLDRENLEEQQSQFQGFINLLIIYAIFFVVYTVSANYQAGLSLLPVNLLRTMLQDIWFVVLSDLTLIAFTFTAFALQLLIVAGFIPRVLVLLLPHVLFSILFALSYAFIIFFQFPWVQKGALMLHTVVLYMKMHSYLATNLQLSETREAERPGAKLHYPKNVTLANYIDYLLTPTLVYEPEYPRTEHGVRFAYLIEKGISCIVALSLLYVTITQYIEPNLEAMAHHDDLIRAVINLALPFMIAYLLVFFIVFECVCNFMAELTRFADRSFYDDWWNSTSFDEFSRKWNKPVHEWLLRHIYLESMRTYKISKLNATIGTFLFSMILHELVLTITGNIFRPYITVLAMCQLPLISIMRHPMIKGTRIGNLLFWFTQVWGVPMLAVLYAREHYGLAPPSMIVIGSFAGVITGFFGALLLIRWISAWKAKPTRGATNPVDTVTVTTDPVPAPMSPKSATKKLTAQIKSPYLLFKTELREKIDPEYKLTYQNISNKANDIWNNMTESDYEYWEERYEREFAHTKTK